MAAPFSRMNVLVMACNVALAAVAASRPDASGRHIELLADRDAAYLKLQGYKSRGKGGKKPRHPSKRFVAQDKRDARKARNRR